MSETNPLIAEALKNDPRVAQAKSLLTAALKEHQKKITGVKSANPQLKANYEQALKDFSEIRGNKLYYPYLGSGIGNGALVELLDGSVKYDFITGIGPHCMGHSSTELLETGIDAALSDTVMQGNLQQNGDAFEFCKLLTQASGLKHCFLTSSGVMANENALKLAFQKHFPASRILAFDHCFFGRSLIASQITDKPSFREGLPISYQIDYIPFFDATRPEESTKQAVKELKKQIKRYPKQHAVMILELVQGEGGFYTAPREFFIELINVLKANNIAVFIDEVQTFGRTSQLFAFQHFELDRFVDIVSIGKLSQVCATLYSDDYLPRPGLLSQTFIGSTSAIRAGTKIVSKLLHEGFYGAEGKVMQVHKMMVESLEGIAKRHKGIIEGPFGVGAMIAFTPYHGDSAKVTAFTHRLFEAGVMSFVAGSDPTRVRFLVPFANITKEEVASAMKIVEETL